MLFSQNPDDFKLKQERMKLRKTRFRILCCIDGTEGSFLGVRHAAEIALNGNCDIVLLYVRQVDQGLRSGGLQVRIARQNMLEWGLDLPGIQYLRQGLDILINNGINIGTTNPLISHTDVWGDPLGDNKIEYRDESGQSVVLKLKTAPDISTGILDQCELGPYNLLILGSPSKWRSRWNTFWGAGIGQKVSMIAPCSVLIAREKKNMAKKKGHLIIVNSSNNSFKSAYQDAVLARHCKLPATLMAVATNERDRNSLEKI